MLEDSIESELTELRAVAEERARFLEITSSALTRMSTEAERRKVLIDELQVDRGGTASLDPAL